MDSHTEERQQLIALVNGALNWQVAAQICRHINYCGACRDFFFKRRDAQHITPDRSQHTPDHHKDLLSWRQGRLTADGEKVVKRRILFCLHCQAKLIDQHGAYQVERDGAYLVAAAVACVTFATVLATIFSTVMRKKRGAVKAPEEAAS